MKMIMRMRMVFKQSEDLPAGKYDSFHTVL